MSTYLKWLTRILFGLAAICAVIAIYFGFIRSPNTGGGDPNIALFYTALVGLFGFGISGLAAQIIAKSYDRD